MTSPIPTEGRKHTPGPWLFDYGTVPPDGPGTYADIYVDGGDTIIAHFNNQIPEGLANARLIAAAPALLEALRVLVPTNIGTPPASVPDGQILPVDMTVGELRKAIAALLQATGGENGR